MLPVIAIVGRPNVGKSTLFNCLTQTRNALVADVAGLTRDRLYGECRSFGQRFIVIDTGGIGVGEQGLAGLTLEQTQRALHEADVILFVVDVKVGLTAGDQTIAAQLRMLQKPIFIIANKVDGSDPSIAITEFYSLGLGVPIPIAAAHGNGIRTLMEKVIKNFPKRNEIEEKASPLVGIKVAIIGRPNVGKSTFVNRVLGEKRVIVSDEAGTTRDSIFIPFHQNDEDYVLIDTAGLRKRGKVTDKIEKFSIVKTLQAVEVSQVVLFILDAKHGITDQDLKLLGFVLESGKALVIAVNKWDGLDKSVKEKIHHELERRLKFVDFAPLYFISALQGTGVGILFKAIKRAYQAAMKSLPTPQVTKALQKALIAHQPPMVHGHRIKLRYAHQGGRNPPVIVIHGNQTEDLPESYRRYLIHHFRQTFDLWGTPLTLQLKSSVNPYRSKS